MLMSGIWIGVLVLAIIAELATSALVAIWFVPSSIVAMILNLLGVSETIQCIVFTLLSAVLLYLFPVKLRNLIQRKNVKTNLDALIGSVGIVEEDIRDMAPGRVKVGGISWSAVSQSGDTIEKGEKVKILDIEGVKLICVPADVSKKENASAGR